MLIICSQLKKLFIDIEFLNLDNYLNAPIRLGLIEVIMDLSDFFRYKLNIFFHFILKSMFNWYICWFVNFLYPATLKSLSVCAPVYHRFVFTLYLEHFDRFSSNFV